MSQQHRIMVVDDDPDVRFVVTSLLGARFETTQALNGLDALEKIERHEPDMLLMDVSMPVMNGIACCQAIKRHEDFQSLPVLYLSAAGEQVKSKALGVGGVDFVAKPFKTEDLISRISTYLQRAHVPRRPKRFSLEEINRIDATPLGEADDGRQEEEQKAAPRNSVPELRERVAPQKGRSRRVFGRKKAPEPPQKEPPAADEAEQSAPPEKPNYRAISRGLRREAESLRQRLEERKRKDTPPPREEPQPPENPPKEAPRREKPSAPAKKESSQPSPAEVLAQRRLKAIGKKGQKSATKPRVLVLIDEQHELNVFNEALKGVAEFLPLEDPVEALVLIARFQPDIVVMGIYEKEYSGLQVARMMKDNPRLSHIETVFIQGPRVESNHLDTARHLTRNQVLPRPLSKDAVRRSVEAVVAKPGFKVRDKQLGYGVYVKEVLREAEEQRRKENKYLEKRAMKEEMHSLAKFMAEELKDYKEPEGYEELKGIGNKVHRVE